MAEQNEPPPASSSPGWQTACSVLILLHLFCLVIAILTNARPSSSIRDALGNVPLAADYLRLVHIDQAYDFPLTQGRPSDGPHRLELELAGSADGPHMLFPDDSMWPTLRRQRYENLAFQIADLVLLFENDPHLQTLLVTGIAQWLLVQEDVPAGTHTLRCLQRAPHSMEEFRTMGLSNTDNSGEMIETVVETRLLWDGEGKLLVALAEKGNLTAPVTEPSSP